MGKSKGLLLLVVGAMFLAGCIIPSYISYDGLVREPKDEQFHVRIYEENELDGITYEIIGEVSIEGCSCELEKMFAGLKEKVKKVGGEGIIQLSITGGIGGRISSDNYLISGKVIVLSDEKKTKDMVDK